MRESDCIRWTLLTLLCFLAMSTITGCGLSAELKKDTAAVIGEGGVTDEYVDAVNCVVKNQLTIMKAYQTAHPDETNLTIVGQDGSTIKVPIADYIKALELLRDYPEKLKKALHALNSAIQSEKGISGFWDQFLRVLQADKLGALFK